MALARPPPAPSPFDHSPSPPLAATTTAGSAPHLPLTKRDVRRNRILDRLQTMIDSFAAHQPQHYRAQLQAVQVDMTLVLRADPYAAEPLEDGAEDIRRMVEGVIASANIPSDEAAQKDFWAMAGRKYGEFVREVNDAMEKRDAELTALHVRHPLLLPHRPTRAGSPGIPNRNEVLTRVHRRTITTAPSPTSSV